MNSYYRCASGGRTVVIWPAITSESGFYDAVITDADDTSRTVRRITAYEAASIVLTELGTPVKTTVLAVEQMIRRWRAELDAIAAPV